MLAEADFAVSGGGEDGQTETETQPLRRAEAILTTANPTPRWLIERHDEQITC